MKRDFSGVRLKEKEVRGIGLCPIEWTGTTSVRRQDL
jgi:hypothetical protein